MRILLLTLCMAFAGLSFSQEKSDSLSIEEIATEMATYDMVTNYSSGIAGTISPQYALFIELKKKATAEELVQLIEHESPIVRSYAFWALANHKDVDRSEIQSKLAKDKTKVTFLYGCVADETTVSALLKRLRYTPMYDDMQQSKLQ